MGGEGMSVVGVDVVWGLGASSVEVFWDGVIRWADLHRGFVITGDGSLD